MHLLFTRFPLESSYGGAEVQTISLMEGLRSRGHEVSFLGSCETLLRLNAELRIKNYALDIGPPPVTKWGAVSFLWRRRGMKKRLEETLEELRVENYELGMDAVIMLSLTEKLLLTPWAVRKGIRVFWIEHDRIGRWLRWNPWLPLLRRLGRNVTTVTVSDFTRDTYIALGWDPEKVVTIVNGIEKGVRDTYQGVGGNVVRLGCISRLTRDKGVDLLIEAVAKIPDVDLRILGRGREEENIRSQIQKLHLDDRVQLVNFVEDIEEFYASIDVLILPTRSHDTFGLVVAEAMMRNIPTICTNECGIARHFAHGTQGLVCEAGSSRALEEAISQLLDLTKRKQVAAAGKIHAEEGFSVERMVEEYNRVVGGW